MPSACTNSRGWPICDKIHHVDPEELNLLGIYSRKVTKVYGE